MTHNTSAAESALPPSGDDKPPSRAARLLTTLFRRKQATLHTVFRDFIDNQEDGDTHSDERSPASQEQTLITNILQLRGLTAHDVMLPRSDIIAIPHDISRNDLIAFVAENPLSRFPVYKGTLDDIIGMIHLKDLFLAMAPNTEGLDLEPMIRDVPIIAPGVPVFDILMTMRKSKKHMVLVVDEYGGIDGILTAGDIIEAIIGRLDDEHDLEEDPRIIHHANGTFEADALVEIEQLEKQFGAILTDDEREDIETLGGLVMAIAGSAPKTGETFMHASGLEFEVLEADSRRVLRVLIKPPILNDIDPTS